MQPTFFDSYQGTNKIDAYVWRNSIKHEIENNALCFHPPPSKFPQLHYYIPPLIYVYACVHEFVVFSEKSERGRDEITSVKCVCAYHRAAGCCGPARSSPVLRRWGAAVHCGTVVEKGWEEASGRMSEQLGPAHMPPRPATPRGRKKINYNLCLIIIYLTLYTRFGSVKQYKCKIGAYQYHRL